DDAPRPRGVSRLRICRLLCRGPHEGERAQGDERASRQASGWPVRERPRHAPITDVTAGLVHCTGCTEQPEFRGRGIAASGVLRTDSTANRKWNLRVASGAVPLWFASAFAQSAKGVRGPNELVAIPDEPPAKLVVVNRSLINWPSDA